MPFCKSEKIRSVIGTIVLAIMLCVSIPTHVSAATLLGMEVSGKSAQANVSHFFNTLSIRVFCGLTGLFANTCEEQGIGQVETIARQNVDTAQNTPMVAVPAPTKVTPVVQVTGADARRTVVERIVERAISPVGIAGVSQEYVDGRLAALAADLRSEIGDRTVTVRSSNSSDSLSSRQIDNIYDDMSELVDSSIDELTILSESDVIALIGSNQGTTSLATFDTDDLAEGSTNLYSQWSDIVGGVSYSGNVTATAFYGDGSNLTGITSFSTSTTRAVFSSLAPGLTYTSGTGVFSLASGYNIPLTASTTEWASKVSSQWATNGANISYAAGNVAIGTTTSTAKLDVFSTTEQLRLGFNASNYLSMTVMSDGEVVLDSVGTDAEFSFSDNVGINTTNPLAELDIYGSSGGSADLDLMRNDSTTVLDDQLGTLNFGSTDGPSRDTASIKVYAAENHSASSAGSYMTFTTTPVGTDVAVERMRISSAGNIGIGSTTPSFKLTVNGGLFADSIASTNWSINSAGYLSGTAQSAYAGGNSGYVLAVNSGGYVYDDEANALSAVYADSADIANNASVASVANSPGSSWGSFFAGNGYFLDANNNSVTGIGIGSVAAPSISFYDDDNTGLWSPAADTLAISTAGSERLRVTSAGNVGIGTTTPSAKFAITGTAGPGNIFAVASSTNARIFSVSSSGEVYLQNALGALIIGDGIGNARGSQALDVQSLHASATTVASGARAVAVGYGNTASASDSVSVGNSNNVSGTNATAFGYLNTASASTVTAIGYGNTASVSSSVAMGLSNNATANGAVAIGIGITNAIAGSMQIGPSNSAKIAILSTGNVGVGTTTPGARLQVAGDAAGLSTPLWTNSQLRISGSTNPNYQLNIGVETSTGKGYLQAGEAGVAYRDLILNNAGGFVGIGTSTPLTMLSLGSGQISVATGTASMSPYSFNGDLNTGMFSPAADALGFSTAGTERMRIGSTGNIGIGTSTPATIFDVFGASNVVSIGRNSGTDDTDVNQLTVRTRSYVNNNAIRLLDRNGSVSFAVTDQGKITVGAYNQSTGTSTGYAAGFNGAIDIYGTGAGFQVSDRTTLSTRWQHYSTGGIFRIYNLLGGVPTEPFTITASTGNVGIGTTTAQRRLHVVTSADDAPVRFEDASGYCEINPTSTTWSCTSDERLKDNIQKLSAPTTLAGMLELRPVEFTWRSDSSDTVRTGLIAQEVERIFPELVNTDERGYKSVSYGGFTVYLISAFQELATKIESIAAWFGEGRFNVSGDVCVDEVCVTKDEFKSLLQNGANVHEAIDPKGGGDSLPPDGVPGDPGTGDSGAGSDGSGSGDAVPPTDNPVPGDVGGGTEESLPGDPGSSGADEGSSDPTGGSSDIAGGGGDTGSISGDSSSDGGSAGGDSSGGDSGGSSGGDSSGGGDAGSGV